MDLDQRLVFSALLLLQAVLCQSQSKMIVPSQPIVVPVGSDVTLPCEVDPVKNLKELVVEWARPDLKPRYIHVRREGVDMVINQNPYQGRSRLSQCGLQCGDMSLKLSRVRLSDGGTYRCFLPQMDTAGEVNLTVVSVSPVAVSLTKDHSGSPVLRCESRGWYPEPELLWLDSDGTVLTGGRTEVQRGVSDETFSISSRLSVEQSPGNTFTCRVRQQQSRQSRETQITVTDEFLEFPLVAWIVCGVGLFLFLSTVVAFLVWKLKISKTGKTSENKDTEREEQERMVTSDVNPQENSKSLELNISEHKENLEKKQEELRFVQAMTNKLTETKELLPKLKEKPQEVIDLLNSQITVRKNKLNTAHMSLLSDKHKECEDQIKELEKQKREYVVTVVEMDEQIKAKDKMILEETQRKEQLEAQINNLTTGAQGENKPGGKPQTNKQRLELSSEHKENLEKIEEEMRVVIHVISKLTETKDFLMTLKEKPQEIIHLTNPQVDEEKIKDELKVVADVIPKLTETKEFLMTLKEKPQEIIHLTNPQVDEEKIEDELKVVADVITKLSETKNALKKLKKKSQTVIRLTDTEIAVEKTQDELNYVVKEINKLTPTKELLIMTKKKNQEIIRQLDSQIAVNKNMSHTFTTVLQDINKERDEQIEKLERQKDLCVKIIQEIDKPIKSAEEIILEATERKGQLERDVENEKKLMETVKRCREAAVGPELQQGSHDVEVNVPMATVKALDQTPGAEREN